MATNALSITFFLVEWCNPKWHLRASLTTASHHFEDTSRSFYPSPHTSTLLMQLYRIRRALIDKRFATKTPISDH